MIIGIYFYFFNKKRPYGARRTSQKKFLVPKFHFPIAQRPDMRYNMDKHDSKSWERSVLSRMRISTHIKAFGLSKVLEYLERDPDANLPKLKEWLERFMERKLPPHYQQIFHSAMSDLSNNWYQLIKSMYADIDSAMLKKLFENFVIHGRVLDWPARAASENWPEKGAPWAVLIDPTFPCSQECRGCGSAIYGVQPERGFDSLDQEIAARKAKGTYLFIFSGLDPLSREQEVIALCNKHSECVFAAITPPESITEQLAQDVLRVGNFFPAVRVDGEMDLSEARRAAALLKQCRLPFGVAFRCTAENAHLAASEELYDEAIARGAKFCWFFTCPAYGPEEPASLEQMEDIHRRVVAFRKTKPLLTLDFWDGPFPAAGMPARDIRKGDS